MQHNWSLVRLNGKVLWFVRTGLLFLFVLMLGMNMVAAQTDDAKLRLGHFVFDVPAVILYMDGETLMGGEDTPLLFGSMTLPSQYAELTAGAHKFAVKGEGESLDATLVDEQEFTLEAGRRYLLAFVGNTSADDLHLILIDETALLASNDITKSAVTLFINNLTGVPSLDFQFNGQPYITNLAYGDYTGMQDPTEGKHSLVTAHGDPAAVILEAPDAVGSPAHFFAVFVFSGTFSGVQWDGYTALYTGQYEGELTILDGGPIAVGESLPVEITDMGQRMRFSLSLSESTVLDIVQSGEEGLDAFLRIYDAADNLLFEIDELSMTDTSGVWDAGWIGLELDAGTYIIEAGTFVDIGIGSFTLSVTESG